MRMRFADIAQAFLHWLSNFPGLWCSSVEIKNHINALLGTDYTTNQVRGAIDYQISKGSIPVRSTKIGRHVFYKLV